MTMVRSSRLCAVALGALLAGALLGAQGCVYRLTIQQGNFLESKDLDRVASGMTRVQVRALLGTPMVADPFQANRWDYVYYAKGSRLKQPYLRQFTVYFEEDKVVRIDRSDAQGQQQPVETVPDVKPPAPAAS